MGRDGLNCFKVDSLVEFHIKSVITFGCVKINEPLAPGQNCLIIFKNNKHGAILALN